jgi:hypothetical protein
VKCSPAAGEVSWFASSCLSADAIGDRLFGRWGTVVLKKCRAHLGFAQIAGQFKTTKEWSSDNSAGFLMISGGKTEAAKDWSGDSKNCLRLITYAPE